MNFISAGNVIVDSVTALGVLIAGTSPSSAQAAGVAALMLSLNPALTPATIQTILDSTADQIVNATSVPDPRQGHGRLNAHRAMVAVAGDPAPVPALPAPAFTQFRAFAYTNSGATTPVAPTIVDVTFPFGAPVNVDGTFRIADIPAIPPGKYKTASSMPATTSARSPTHAARPGLARAPRPSLPRS